MRNDIDSYLFTRVGQVNKIKIVDFNLLFTHTADAIDSLSQKTLKINRQKIAPFSGNTITVAIPIPSDLRRFKLKRTGVEMTLLDDYTLVGSLLSLTVASQNESFVIDVE
jgi:hypothetical protein